MVEEVVGEPSGVEGVVVMVTASRKVRWNLLSDELELFPHHSCFFPLLSLSSPTEPWLGLAADPGSGVGLVGEVGRQGVGASKLTQARSSSAPRGRPPCHHRPWRRARGKAKGDSIKARLTMNSTVKLMASSLLLPMLL